MPPQSNSLDPSVKKFPKMVVFDLDYTLWPLHVHDLVAPFKKIGQKVMDAKGTLIKYYRGVPEILRYLKENKCLVAAASRTSEILHAKQILNLINLNQYFSNKEIYPGVTCIHVKKGMSHAVLQKGLKQWASKN
ncbi:hypothetical protein M8J75_011688 [Diaphorina citri]|nr:hypothetical protein M8J75_011688 [Diaphorina citri]